MSILESAAQRARLEIFKQSDHLSLGQLINDMEALGVHADAEIWFDFGYTFPTSLDSWRGIYSELALNYIHYSQEPSTPMKYTDFINMLRGALDSTFYGYKGGKYVMHSDTPIWVSKYGEAANTAVVGVRPLNDHQIIINTKYIEPYGGDA
jgi:uncharacterized protein (UPF0303 family)